MKENNLQKKPSSAEEYANLFLLDENGKKRDFSNVNSVCFFTIGYAETLWILLQEFAGKDITIVDRKSEIDFIKAVIKIHKRDDIKITQMLEVETEDAILNTIFNKDMSFDLVIANPPYGSHSSIAKQINKCLIGNFPSVIEVCQPSGFEAFYEYAINVKEGAAFDDAGVFTMVAAFKENKVNKYKSDMDFRLSADEKEHEFYKAVTDYNRSHKSCFEFIEGIWENLDKIKNKDLFFAVGFFTPCANTRVGCLAKPKGAAELFNLKKPVKKIWGGFQFENNECLKNFFNFWYGISNGRENGWTSIAEQRGSIIDMILKCLERAGGSTPGMKKYKKLFPNLDWSHPWTDSEILKEIGLPEDFLKEKE